MLLHSHQPGIFLAVLLSFLVHPAQAQPCKRRALVIGISKYSEALTAGRQPRAGFSRRIDDLAAPPQDVNNILSVLPRYGFTVRTLTESQATRAAILAAIAEELPKSVGPGLCFLFYYSGHGSLRHNTATGENDETIVPADARLGVPDIRDKEFSRLFQPAAARGVRITAIFDSCHSGSMLRGKDEQLEVRQVDPYPEPIYDPPPPSALDAGVLTLGATHSKHLAYEFTETSKRAAGGAFTQTLVGILKHAHPDTPAQKIYQETVNRMPVEVAEEQQPVLEASKARRALALFGWQTSDLSGRLDVFVSRVIDQTSVELQAGFVTGVEFGAELILANSKKSDAPRIRVGKMLGPSAAVATLISGSLAGVEPGMLFTVDKWKAPPTPRLRLRLTESSLTSSQLLAMTAALSPLQSDPRLQLIDDPMTIWPTHRIRYLGGTWQLQRAGGPSISLGTHPTAESVLAAIQATPTQRKSVLFIELPVAHELSGQISLGTEQDEGRVVRVGATEVADYALMGRGDGKQISYAWVQTVPRSSGALSAPERTAWVPLDGNARAVGQQLLGLSRGLARILGWLNLSPPEQRSFPYRLTFVRKGQAKGMQLPARTKPVTEPFSAVYEGEHFAVRLIPEAAAAAHFGSQPPKAQHVYLFVIDSEGKSTMLFPEEEGCSNDKTVLSASELAQLKPIDLDRGRATICSQPPAGLDVYILLTSEQELPDPCILSFDRIRGGTGKPLDELSKLLQYLGGAQRGVKEPEAPPVSLSWSIQQLPLVTNRTGASEGISEFCHP